LISLEESVISLGKTLRDFESGYDLDNLGSTENVSKSILAYGKILDSCSKLLLKYTLRGMIMAVSADIEYVKKSEKIEIIRNDLDSADKDIVNSFSEILTSISSTLES
jgi:hypothetical protein